VGARAQRLATPLECVVQTPVVAASTCKGEQVAIPLIVTDDSGIVTGRPGNVTDGMSQTDPGLHRHR
jgi:hypothetical protein